ncbi:FAD dependent oxidoreductase [Stereum hirsutum FP-91666 SS1]|uniref:FAD dependent oxidoreductase n=1 Tax=Stereum hirsutum (strain FP-91666) TaxID=721885 RepID=UPI000440B70E|nr:FAD dependent oxidoreductase [Stereum hirsutum FP-91666 SS1]EIM91354.1 FAD dependent oxidoreductase [Stereum hirsutum FP-91666 SS1]
MSPDTTTPYPGFPHPDPCLSFWLQGTRSSPLLGHRTTETLPESAEVVIIGSGLSGAATAYFLLTSPNPPKSVVVVEAREACHGATGRNGGHCRPDCYRGYKGYKTQFGREQALKILQNEMDTLNLVTEIVKKENVDCDFWRGMSYDVAMDQSCADNFHAAFEEFKADGGKVEGVVEWVSDADLAKQRTRCPSAHAAAHFPAASLWPYKLVQHLLTMLIEKHGLNLQTNTVVESVEAKDDGSHILHTPRGTLSAQKVIYCSNAYTATLLPEFKGKIAPFRGQCSAIVPTRAVSGTKMLKETMSYRWGLNDFDYMIQRPKDGIIILGGGRWKAPIELSIPQTDDSIKIPEFTKHLSEAMPGYVTGWKRKEALNEGLLVDWTGVMGYTPEAVPYVGSLSHLGRTNEFINAGHSGHGMARIMTCSRGLAHAILNPSAPFTFEETGVPECFEPTKERLAMSKVSVEDMWREVGKGKREMMH